MTIAFTFPGQGSQAVGMGKELAAAFPEARAVFDEVEAPRPAAGLILRWLRSGPLRPGSPGRRDHSSAVAGNVCRRIFPGP